MQLHARSLLTSFPGSSLALMKNKNGGSEPGIDSHAYGWSMAGNLPGCGVECLSESLSFFLPYFFSHFSFLSLTRLRTVRSGACLKSDAMHFTLLARCITPSLIPRLTFQLAHCITPSLIPRLTLLARSLHNP